ncbi:hypothetical protein FWK35_00012932 [Aphis craccivora]|uniref:C2H2-type domain-containing protein n=1 Tax=Aphis craccivora TaxID=307492 RepID=A0A6G0ZE42_APHCR|nr:hypothetical protein FWK35_00012932 [Aphis craccivora]
MSQQKKIHLNNRLKKNYDIHNTCDTCHKVFLKRVALKKHLEQHEKSSSGLEIEQSDYEMADIVQDVEITEADLLNEKNEDESEGSNVSDIASDLI